VSSLLALAPALTAALCRRLCAWGLSPWLNLLLLLRQSRKWLGAFRGTLLHLLHREGQAVAAAAAAVAAAVAACAAAAAAVASGWWVGLLLLSWLA
jgi:fatty acid desaturase